MVQVEEEECRTVAMAPVLLRLDKHIASEDEIIISDSPLVSKLLGS
jgi:hypothetical protein